MKFKIEDRLPRVSWHRLWQNWTVYVADIHKFTPFRKQSYKSRGLIYIPFHKIFAEQCICQIFDGFLFLKKLAL